MFGSDDCEPAIALTAVGVGDSFDTGTTVVITGRSVPLCVPDETLSDFCKNDKIDTNQ